MKAVLAFVMAMVVGQAGASGQISPPADRLALLAPLVGKWSGPTEGEPGTGTTEREYEHILGARFVELRNRSTTSRAS
jgi:hypothetical protein